VKRLLVATTLALVLASCSGTRDKAEPTPLSGARTTATTSAEVAAPSRCLPYSMALAEELITNGDTGKRRVDGPITKAAAVKSTKRIAADASIPPQRNKALYFVSVNVGGRIVTVVHSDVEDVGNPTGSGLWASLDAFSEVATSFPFDPSTPLSKTLRASLDTDGAKESRACVA
jgi:hypothetical protein